MVEFSGYKDKDLPFSYIQLNSLHVRYRNLSAKTEDGYARIVNPGVETSKLCDRYITEYINGLMQRPAFIRADEDFYAKITTM